MNIRIQSLQEGGAFPFADYVPFMGMNLEKPSTNTAKEDSNDIGIKDLLSMVEKMEGLPSDMQSLVNSLTTLYKANPVGNPTQVKNLAITTYLSALLKVKTAKFNLNQFNHAYTEVVKNGGLNEVAINEHGYLYCMNAKGDKKLMSVQEYLNLDSLSDNIYLALTNANLLRYRAEAPDLAFTNDLLGIVSNGIGLELVTKFIHDAASKLGTNEITLEGYTATLADKIIEGLDLLSNSNEPILVKLKNSTKELKELLNLAIDYLWKTLPTNAKTWLLLRSGDSKDATAGGKRLMSELMAAGTNLEQSYQMDIQSNLNINGTKKESDNSKLNTNPYVQIQRDLGGETRPLTIITADGTEGMSVEGTWYGALPKVNSDMSMDALLATGILNIVESRDAITFGDLAIGSDHLKDIMYDNKGGTTAYLPMKYNSEGARVVNLEALDAYKYVLEAVKDAKHRGLPLDLVDLIMGDALKESGLEAYVNSDGTPNYKLFGHFLVVDAYTTDKVEFNKKSKYILKVKDPDSDLEQKLIKGLSTTKPNSSGKGSYDYAVDVDDWGLFEFFHDDVYRANVYIPLVANQNAGFMGWGLEIKESQADRKESDYLSFRRKLNAGSINASDLGI